MVNKNNYHFGRRLVCNLFFIVFFSLSAGIFIGLIIAPQSGKRLRQSLRVWLDEMVERGKFTIEEAKLYGIELIDRSKGK